MTDSFAGGRLPTATPAAPIDERARWRRRLWMALGALLVVRLIALALNRTDLFFDEAQYWTWSLEPAFGYYSKPPLIAWLIGMSTSWCGSSELCIRLPSPILHTATAAAIFALGSRLYGHRTGFLAALAFATVPGVSLSAGIISTDVPLLLCWALALVALAAMLDGRGESSPARGDSPAGSRPPQEVLPARGDSPAGSRPPRAVWPGVLLGIALGLGLNAKYAMAYFVLCLALYIAITPSQRWLLGDRRLLFGLGLGAALIAPNLIWNATNSFATFAHTADNAKWGGAPFHPGKALEFLGAQFGVFGPVLFGGLLIAAWRWWRVGMGERERLLLAFSLPIIAIVTVQALISRAHANWAAPAYVAATVLVVATLEREAEERWLRASFWINGAAMAVMIVAVAFAGQFSVPRIGDPFARTLGWKEVAGATRAKLVAARVLNRPFGAVITDERALTAELLYYMRGEPTPVLAWLGRSRPQDHYELKRPFVPGSPEPVLLVALRSDSEPILQRFEKVERLTQDDLPAGGTARRRVTFYALGGYKGP